MCGSIAALNGSKPAKEKKRDKREKGLAASSSKSAENGKSSGKNKGKNKQVADDDVNKRRTAIQKLDGVKLEKVIQIVHEGVPEIRDVSFVSDPCSGFPHFGAVVNNV